VLRSKTVAAMSTGGQAVGQEVLLVLISALAGLVGVALGGWLTTRSERTSRRLAFIERRLNEFYAPMLGLLTDIRLNADLRVRIQNAGAKGWQTHVATNQWDFGPFQKLLEHDNEKFRAETLPAYRQMLALYREKMSLAFPDTIQHYPKFLEFVSVWERHLEGAMPVEAIQALKHSEQNCHPFYESILRQHDMLVKMIAKATPG
jgi:hypothetical protein